MAATFTLAACAEMLWRDRPMEWRARRLTELGFHVGLWNWPDHDLAMLEKSGATFSIMNGYLGAGLPTTRAPPKLLRRRARRSRSASGSVSPTQPARHRPGRRRPADRALRERHRRDVAQGARHAEPHRRPRRGGGRDVHAGEPQPAVDHPGVPVRRAEDTLALVSVVNRPQLRSISTSIMRRSARGI